MRLWIPLLVIASFSLRTLPGDMTGTASDGQWVALCSGGLIRLDLPSKDEDPTPPIPHHKACHAVCCQRGDGEAKSENETDNEIDD